MAKHNRILQRFLLVAGLALSALFGAHAALAQNVTQGYQTEQQLQKGMLVRLKPGDGSKIQALTQADGDQMLGVVVSSSDAPVSLSNVGVDQEIFVANYGRYDVLVSDQNGHIGNGDFVVISSLAGVGMKADASQELVIGKALKNFDGASDTIGSTRLETSDGKRSVNLGRIPVEISVAHNPMFQKDTPPGVPDFLVRLAEAVTDRPVTAFRVYASLAVLLASVFITGVLLFVGVRSGMIAIGRNPLAKRSIMRNLLQVTLMALIVFLIGVIAVYLLLRV